ncbi:myelin protein zero-like protein 2 [Spea bombifrons]|uniref:myelin protein zero-like protein 2 n=1 Tax=Spea bombifrons TaxID=233779 RepID=UPI00234964C4|nr:myelin protein zero-like protein 2 [Spea bombifrons]
MSALGTLVVLGALFILVSPMEVFTPKELEALNGTDTRLKCTFSSSSPLGDGVSVSWTYRPLVGNEVHLFYYQKQPFPPHEGRFLGRAVWDGNIKRSDGSILLRNLHEMDNGTYLCQVKNPPDVHGERGEIQLRVVYKAKVSEIHILLLAIGIGSAVIILVVLAVVLWRYYRTQKRSTPVSMLECTEKLNGKPHDMMGVIA